MKTITLITFLSLGLSGCYVPMPSVGVQPPKVHNVKKCKYITDGKVECVHARTWTK